MEYVEDFHGVTDDAIEDEIISMGNTPYTARLEAWNELIGLGR